MTTDAIHRPSRAWLALKVMALLACLFFGLKVVESFLVYSFQAGGLSGSSAYRDRYDAAREGQLLTLLAFVVSQTIGGTVLMTMVGTEAANWGERIKSVSLFSLGFALVTGLVTAVIALVH